MTDNIRSNLENLRDFRFEQYPNISAPQEQLDCLTEFMQWRLGEILV